MDMVNPHFAVHGDIDLQLKDKLFKAQMYGVQSQLNGLLNNNVLNLNTQQLQQANKEVLNLSNTLRTALNPSSSTLDLSMFQAQLKQSNTSLVKYTENLMKYGQQGEQAYLSLTRAISSAEAPTTRVGTRLKEMGQTFKNTMSWQLSSSAIHGVLNTYNQAIGYAKELNRSLTDIRIVTGQSTEQMSAFAKQANIAAKNLSSTTTRYTDAALIYYQQGLSDKQVKDRADVTIKMANVAGISAEKASQQLTAIWNNFDNGSKSLEHYADVLVKLGAETASSSEEISKGMQKFAAIGNTVGLSYEYAASALATVTATTRESADTVGTSFRTLFSRLQGLSLGQTLEDGTTLNKYSKALNTIGVRIKETNGDMKSMNVILDEIGSKWGNLNKDTQIALAQSIGGARQYSTFMALMDNWDYFQENVDRANSASGSLQKQQEIYAESWEAASKRVKASLEGIFDTVIDDKAIIKMTKGFSGLLDFTGGSIKGFGGFGGITSLVAGSIMSRYTKELPRLLGDLKYNLGYTFNRDGLYTQQDNLFKDAISGINTLAAKAGVAFEEQNATATTPLGMSLTKDDVDVGYAQQLMNERLNLLNKQHYAQVERSLSQREKDAYQVRLGSLSQAQNMAQISANVWQQVRSETKEILSETEKRQFQEYIQKGKTAQQGAFQTYQNQKYDLTNSAQFAQYKQAQIIQLDKEKAARENAAISRAEASGKGIKSPSGQFFVPSEEQKQIDAWYQGEVAKINAQADSQLGGYKDSIQMSQAQREVLRSKEFGDLATSRDTINRYNSILAQAGKSGYVGLGDRTFLSGVFRTMQKPALETGKSFGVMNATLRDFNKSLSQGTEISKEQSTTMLDQVKNYRAQLQTQLKGTPELKAYDAAFGQLKKAMAGTDVQAQKDALKNYQTAFGEAQNKFEQTLIDKKILTKEDVARLTTQGSQLGEAQYDASQKRGLLRILTPERMDSMWEKAGKVAQTATFALTALQSGTNLANTMANKNASTMDKITAGLGAGASTLMLGSSLYKTLDGVKGAGVISLLASVLTTVAPIAIDWVDKRFESKEEKNARLDAWAASAAEKAQVAKQEEQNLQSQLEQQSELAYQATYAESGSLDQIQSIQEANDISQQLIDKYKLEAGKDYFYNSQGLIDITDSAKQAIQETAQRNSIDASIRSDLLHLGNLSREYNEIADEAGARVALESVSGVELAKLGLSSTDEGVVMRQGGSQMTMYYDVTQRALQKIPKEKLEAYNGTLADNIDQSLQTPNEQYVSALNNQQRRIQNAYHATLTEIASLGGLTDTEKAATEMLSRKIDANTYSLYIDQLDKDFGKAIGTEGGRKTEQQAKDQLYDYLKDKYGDATIASDEYAKIISSEAFNALTDTQAKANYLIETTKEIAFQDRVQGELKDQAQKINQFEATHPQYKDLSNQSFAQVDKYIKNVDNNIARLTAGIDHEGKPLEDTNFRIHPDDLFAMEYLTAERDRAITTLSQAVGQYTTNGAVSYDGRVLDQYSSLQLNQMEQMGNVLQDYGEVFGTDLGNTLLDTINHSDNKDMLLSELSGIDLSGSTINSLYNLKNYEGTFKTEIKDLFTSAKESIGGDSGIFAALAQDDAIQKVVKNFKQLGDIDAAAIVKAAHSSSDLAQSLEIADFNAGGLSLALQGVASGAISQNEVTDSLLGVLSDISAIESNSAEAFDFMNNLKLSDSVYKLGQNYGKVAKQMYSIEKAGNVMDAPLLEGYELIFGEEVREKYEEARAKLNKGEITQKEFDEIMKDEKKALSGLAKNGNFASIWEYGFKKAAEEFVYQEKKDEETGEVIKTYTHTGEKELEKSIKDYDLRIKNEQDPEVKAALMRAQAAEQEKLDELKGFTDKFVVRQGGLFVRDAESGGIQQIQATDKDGNPIKGKTVNNGLIRFDSATGQLQTMTPTGTKLEDSEFLKQFSTLDEFKDAMKFVIKDDGIRAAAIDDFIKKNAGLHEAWQSVDVVNKSVGEQFFGGNWDELLGLKNEYNKALENGYDPHTLQDMAKPISDLGKQSDFNAERDGLITADQLKLIYDSSDALKKEFKNFDDWTVALMDEEKSPYAEAFKQRYVNFGDIDVGKSSWEQLTKSYGVANGVNGEKALTDKIIGVAKNANIAAGKSEDAPFNIEDINDITQAMGLNNDAQIDALQAILDNGKEISSTVTGINGGVQTFTSNSEEFKTFLGEQGQNYKNEAEAFTEFIGQQKEQQRLTNDMITQNNANLEYQKLIASGAYDSATGKWDQEKYEQYQAEVANNSKKGLTAGVDDKGNLIWKTAGGQIVTNPSSYNQVTGEGAVDEKIYYQQREDPLGLSDNDYKNAAKWFKTDDNGNLVYDQNGRPVIDPTGSDKVEIKGQQYTKDQLAAIEDAYYNTGWLPDGWTANDFQNNGSISSGRNEIKNNETSVDNANKIADAIANKVGNELKDLVSGKKASGQNQSKITKHYVSGKNNNEPYEGLAQVGEEGPELTIDSDGNATMLGVDGPTYAYVEKDDIIFTADQTKDILRTNPSLTNIPGFSEGNLWEGLTSSSHGYGDVSGSSGGSSGGGGDSDDDWEPDRYIVISEQLQDLQREYTRLAKAKERAFGADKIRAIDKEIASLKELNKAQQAYIDEITEYKEKDLQKMKDLGIDVDNELIFDRNGVIRNFDEIEEKYKKAAEEGDQDAAKKWEAIQKFMETNNLLQQATDSLIDLEWQLLDAELARITTKVDIQVAVDDTELQYLQYQMTKISEDAYDVAKALSIVGQQMDVVVSRSEIMRKGLAESLTLALQRTELTAEEQQELYNKIINDQLTEEDLKNLQLDENSSQSLMETILNYRSQIIATNANLMQYKNQIVELVEKHFTKFNDKIKQQTQLLDIYNQTLTAYSDLAILLNGQFNENLDNALAQANSVLSKNAKTSLEQAAIEIQSAEMKYLELQKLYNDIGDSDTQLRDSIKKSMETSYIDLQAAIADFQDNVNSSVKIFMSEFTASVERAVKNFSSQISPIFKDLEGFRSAFDRQNQISEQYVSDYEKYYQLNKMYRDLQSSIDETDNINNKKALAKLQDTINSKKAAEVKLSEYDIQALQQQIELEKARLALDEAKNAKSTVTLSRDQNGNWGYIYTAEEDKVAEAEQAYEDRLHEYQQANDEYLKELEQMAIDAFTNMQDSLLALDVNDPAFNEKRKNILNLFEATMKYIDSQGGSAFANNIMTEATALERFNLTSINLIDNFKDLSLSSISSANSLSEFINTSLKAMTTMNSSIINAKDVYQEHLTDIKGMIAGSSTLEEYLLNNIDKIATKSDETIIEVKNIYAEMAKELGKVNEEVQKMFEEQIPYINGLIAANEQLAESIYKIQKQLSDLSEVELPSTEGTIFEHPEGYTENDYGVIKKLSDDEKTKLEEIKKEIQVDDSGFITNYEDLKNKWFEEAPAEGEEDKRDATKKAYWELLQDYIKWKGYTTESGIKISTESINSIITSNAQAMANAVTAAMARTFDGGVLQVEQSVDINAVFPNVTDRNEIEEALNNLINDAAQYANRKN